MKTELWTKQNFASNKFFRFYYNLRKSIIYPLIIGIGLGLLLVLIYVRFILPQGKELDFPKTISYYFILLVAIEAIFHLVPLALFYIILKLIYKQKLIKTYIINIGLLIFALIEPTMFMIGIMHCQEIIAMCWMIFLCCLFTNIIQLDWFFKYGIVSMVIIRLGMYIIWYLTWGVIQIQ